jgi:sugar lactone lactonase YvrE
MDRMEWFPLLAVAFLVGCTETDPVTPILDDGHAWAEAGSAGWIHAAAFPATIELPNGFQPEGFTVGLGNTFWVGSLAGPYMGAVYRGDLRSGEGEIIVPPVHGGPPRQAVGLAFDERSGLLFVAGGGFNVLEVFDGDEGTPVAALTHPDLGLANDVILTRDAAWVTDSFRPVLYRIDLGPAGRLSPTAAVEELPLSGDYEFDPGVFMGINNNGIAVTPDGRSLVVVNYGTGLLYRVDPATGVATVIEVEASLAETDGLVLHGRTLYAIRNIPNRVVVIELAPDFASGTVVREIMDERLRIPTTGAIFGDGLYVVNARFDVASPFGPPPPDILEIDFDVVRLDR